MLRCQVATEWGDAAPFQYVATTTHADMRESLRSLLCIPSLGSDGPGSYLFGKDLTVIQRLVAEES
jgi:hypothetical protein